MLNHFTNSNTIINKYLQNNHVKPKIKPTIHQQIINEGLQICVVSYGGCSSNTLTNTLEQNNYKCITPIWETKLCHSPELINTNIPIIYLYRDPRCAFLSMKHRGKDIYNTNQQKLSNNKNTKISDENLLKLMIKQFHTWTSKNVRHVLVLQYEELFIPNISNKLKLFLKNNNLQHFPIQYKKPTFTGEHLDDLDIKYKLLFEKYKTDIDYINNYKAI